MKTQEARDLGQRLGMLVQARKINRAHRLLAPVLAQRTAFALLRHVGAPIGQAPPVPANALLELIAADRTMGGWVIIASALEQQLGCDLTGALARCRCFIVAADAWYAADTLGEGVAGQALVRHFQPALDQIRPWPQDANPWVRRAAGTSTHFWAKRSRGAAELQPQAEALLALLAPVFEEGDTSAVKGIGWGLKTLGRNYPDLVADWLAEEIIPGQRRHRALMLRKALTYLSAEQRARALGEIPIGRSSGETEDSHGLQEQDRDSSGG
jgi:hypothetical protein